MLKRLLSKSFLLLFALAAGTGSVWAEEVTKLSFSRSGSSDTTTQGYAFSTTAEGKTGYYQDKGTVGTTEVNLMLYSSSDPLFSSTPSTITFTAKLGAGSTKDPLGNSVRVCFVDNMGNAIEGTETDVTTKITNTTGSDFSVSMPVAKATEAYGVKIYHIKEQSWNVRYYSFSLMYEASTGSAASAPEFSLEAGAYIYGTTFTLSSSNSKKIFYTTDGSEPTASSNEYTGAIAITSTMTVKAIAIDNDDQATIIVSRTFSVKTPDAPTFTPVEGNVAEGTEVTISAEEGCVINYTTDGSDPLTSSTATLTSTNSATETVNTTTTIRAIALDGGSNESAEASATFVVVDADAMTETKNSFGETSGTLVNEITFQSNKGGAGTAPANYNNGIRLYQISGSNSYGGYITLTAPTGFKILGVTITSTNTYATTVTYTVDGSTDVTENASFSLAKSSKYTINGLNNSSVSIFNLGTSSSGRLEIGSISVLYTGGETISLASACTDGTNYYGTYSSFSHDFVVPSDVTVSEIKVVAGKLEVSNYGAGDVVPANTGVMLSSSTSGDKTIKFTGREGTSILGDANMLKATGKNGLTSAGMSAASGNDATTKFYRLTMHNGTDIGFWYGGEDGAAFEIAANKAYLAVPASAAGARAGFSFFGDESTGIDAVRSENMNGEAYNLNGQRVAQPTKGLYIVKGKKVIIK